jgi:2-polyprenyl-6-methoxyphenol hydroxylase-like FAD-dependent oxidoreductase
MGGAAHARVPHQARGANQTIEDAIALADELATAEASGDLATALRRYPERRRDRTARVQRWSRRAADLMHLPDGPGIAPRDALFQDRYSPQSRDGRRPRAGERHPAPPRDARRAAVASRRLGPIPESVRPFRPIHNATRAGPRTTRERSFE